MRMDTSGKKNSWRERIRQPKEPFNPEKEIEKEKYPSPNDIRLTHPENNSNIVIKDNGTIQMFAGDELGLKLDPNSKSFQVYSDKSLFNSNYINFSTATNGLRWNYTPFNRALANPWKEVLTTLPGGGRVLENSLTSGSPYISPAGPCVPGTATAINAINLEGENILKGFEYEKRTERYTAGIKELISDLVVV